MTSVVELLLQYVWNTHLMYLWFEETYDGNTLFWRLTLADFHQQWWSFDREDSQDLTLL